MTAGWLDALLIAVPLAGIIGCWWVSVRREESDKAAERGRRNFGRTV
jgi:hypothetical protein